MKTAIRASTIKAFLHEHINVGIVAYFPYDTPVSQLPVHCQLPYKI